MRALILVTGAALALSACGNDGQAGKTANVDEVLTAEDIVSNDVTAIDAVTGAAANMAADMPLDTANEGGNDLGNAGTSPGTAPRPAKPKPAAEAPATNGTVANETANVAVNAAE